MSKSFLTLISLFILFQTSGPVFAQGDQLLHEGIKYFDAGNYDKAIDTFSKASSKDKNNSMIWLWLGKAYIGKVNTASIFWKMRKGRKMKDFFIKAVDLDPENLEAREYLGGYYLNAPSIVGGDKDKAIEQAKEIKKRDYLKGSLFFAQIHEVMERDDEAEAIYMELIESDSTNTHVQYSYGMFHQSRENYTAALWQFENSILADSTNMNAYYQIGRTSVFSGENLNRAIECLVIFLDHPHMKDTPKYESAHWRLGMLYEHKGMIEAARNEYKSALAINPDHKETKNALKNLRK